MHVLQVGVGVGHGGGGQPEPVSPEPVSPEQLVLPARRACDSPAGQELNTPDRAARARAATMTIGAPGRGGGRPR